jgi:biopolymer transport protein ExbB
MESKFDEARHLFDNTDIFIAGPFQTLIVTYKNKPLCDEKLGVRLGETLAGLKKSLWILATVASVSPFIGLFGTVIGIINAFDAMAKTGKGGFSVVAAGLSEALISTAAGILVAVVALIFYNYFLVRANHIYQHFKQSLEDLQDALNKQAVIAKAAKT